MTVMLVSLLCSLYDFHVVYLLLGCSWTFMYFQSAAGVQEGRSTHPAIVLPSVTSQPVGNSDASLVFSFFYNLHLVYLLLGHFRIHLFLD